MLARLLFACVWLVIAAAVLLPFSPIDMAAPDLAIVNRPISVVDATADDGACERSCSDRRRGGVGAMAAPVCLNLQVRLVIHPAPATPPPKGLPAI